MQTNHKRKIKKFQAAVWNFYHSSGRDLPWRHTRNAYHILVSEVMLQQTQVARVLEKYPLFLKQFPTVQSLARAPMGNVLRAWQGMGYNRRALYLKKIAEEVVKRYKGKIPQSEELLDALPGIGANTAGAVMAFAFNTPSVFIETNIRRVFIYFFFPKKNKVRDEELMPLIREAVDRKNPREWYWALMDYGSVLPKKIANPNRKSTSYHKQSPFKGSLRAVRGAILRLLLKKSKMHVDELVELLKESEARTEEAVAALLCEGFVVRTGNHFSLK